MISHQAKHSGQTLDSQRWRRLKNILADALEQETPATRAAAVVQLCDGDPELLVEAESLLAEAEALLQDAGDDLEDCANNASTVVAPEDAFAIGERVGAYMILRKIGEGGMGTVYLAARADGCFEKQVAIKVLKRGSDGDEVIRRFQAEREVLAWLDHPNIARLIDAGATAAGLPYLVMEYVNGTPITRFVAENRPSIAERLSLFRKIGAAVEAAHRNSVIHRDLKPTNILVNREGEPKLLDFGIATLVDGERNALEKTALGQDCFTPVSASPEQAKGERVTVASDVYALGGVLYELLTETRPLRFPTTTPSRNQVVQAVCEQRPTAPSCIVKDRERQRALRGDLDAIVLTALEKDPSKRYPSVASLMEDIERYLTAKPVHVREDQPAYRIRKFLSRNRWVHLGIASACTALLFAATLFFRSGYRGTNSTNLAESSVAKTSNAQAIPEKSIAVLPFNSLSPEQGNSYFSDGIADDVLTALAKVGELKVISHTSVAPYSAASKNIAKIRADLHVAYILEGSAQKFGDRIRVNARLIDTRTETQVWAEQYDRKLDDLFAVQSELAQAIASQLKGTLSPDEKAAIESHPTADTVAYDFYLRARESFFQSNWRNALHLVEKAVARDSHFALAYCLLTEVRLYLYRFDKDRTAECLEKAKQAAEMASTIAPNLPQSHLAKAQYYYYGLHDFKSAQAQLRAAAPFPIADESKFVDLTALTERRLGHWKDAIRDGERAAELDPQNPFVINELVESYMAVRRFNEAEQLANTAIKANFFLDGYLWGLKSDTLVAMGRIKEAAALLEDSPVDLKRFHRMVMTAILARDFTRASQLLKNATAMEQENANVFLLNAFIARGELDKSKAQSAFQLARDRIVKELRERPDDPQLISNLGLADAGLGSKDIALQEARHAVELCPMSLDAVEAPGYRMILAIVYAWTGESEAAISELQSIVSVPSSLTCGDLRFNLVWDPLRGDPRFNAIMAASANEAVAQ